ncbi:MAG: hypothetical protein ACQEQS_05475 [Thermodesulfobacteriota bacterium]
MKPGSKEEFLTQKQNFKTRSVNDRRKVSVPVKKERRSFKDRRNDWTIEPETGISTFLG